VPEARINVVPNGVNVSLFSPMDKFECRKKLRLLLDKKIVLYAGNFVHVKGVDVLVDGFAGLRVNGLLVLVGDGAA